MGIVVYIAFCLLVLWGALRQQTQSRRSGLLFACLALTIPLWVMGMYGLFLLLTGNIGK